MRIALGVEYLGTNYSGWQSQVNDPHVPTIQSQIDRAIALIANHAVTTTCAGRTDAGVHACGQVVHCDVQSMRSAHAWVFGCNRYLPDDVRVLWMRDVPDSFSARNSAVSRHYKYVIYNNSIRPSLLHNYVGWYHNPLDAEKMETAAQTWVGEHDFSSFRAAGCQSRSPVRALKGLTVQRKGDMIFIDIIADAFLYHMVRNMVGVLLQIGCNRKPICWAQEVLVARNRTKASITASPHGLYLANVMYPDALQIPQPKTSLWFFN